MNSSESWYKNTTFSDRHKNDATVSQNRKAHTTNPSAHLLPFHAFAVKYGKTTSASTATQERQAQHIILQLVEGVLWVNGQSQPTSALPEISTISLLFAHRLYKWRSQLHSVQGEANQMNHGKKKESERERLQWPYRPVPVVSSHLVFLFAQKHRHANMKGAMSNSQHHTFIVSVWCARRT